MIKKISASVLTLAVAAASAGFTAAAEGTDNSNITDKLVLGDAASETAHDFKETNTVSGTDTELSKQQKDEDGLWQGGGVGDGLTYRQMQVPPDGESGMMEFTLRANPGRLTYITIRVSGSQYDRGNLLMYGAGGDTSVLDAYSGREYAELYNGQYTEGPPCYGRYSYLTYKLPEGMVSADGTVTLSIWHKGAMDSYGTSTYRAVTQPSMYIYSVYSSDDPYFVPDDDFDGTGKPAEQIERDTSQFDVSAYEYLKNEVDDMTELVMSWQCWGDEWERKKTDANAYFEGAVIRNTPVANGDFSGEGDAVSRRYAQNAILHQNWSPLYNLKIFANAYIYDFSGDKHNNPELLDRYIALLDFFQRAQDSKGGWCYFQSGEDKGKWIGVSLDGTGERLTGDYWPLMSLGADAMLESFIELVSYTKQPGNEGLAEQLNAYLDEVIDGDLTGANDRTRRDYYVDMFGRLRDRLANPLRGVGDFYAPTNRAGTANQDFGSAYNANFCMTLLCDGADVNSEYKPENGGEYLDEIKYKYGEMVDGEKWFSTQNGLGLENGASHGGWAGDYEALLMSITDKYAECSEYMDEDAQKLLRSQALRAYDSGKYFFYIDADAEGNPRLVSECLASSRKDGYGQHFVYPIAGYTAVKLGSDAAMRYLELYIEHDMGYYSSLRSDFEVTKSPHIYGNLLDTQSILKYYKDVESEMANGKASPLPMESEHEDFAWYDPDAHVFVFKNDGARAYITLNFRREKWQYNDYARVHFTTDTEDRTAEVRARHEGGIYTWEDSTHLTENGKPYTHTRYNGYEEVKYGKYICGMNLSETDETVGQTGSVYYADTTGVTKAKDLISGTVYESSGGEDISVPVEPGSAVVLEVLESVETKTESVIYKLGNDVMGFDTFVSRADAPSKTISTDEWGDISALVEPRFFDGCKKSRGEVSGGTVIYDYETDSAPEFEETIRETEPEPWRVYNYGTAEGTALTDENGDITEISSRCAEGKGNLDKTFAYKEVTGDFKIHVKLNGFDKTATDKEYFSILAADSLDFETANFFELRHFSNNNNILLVSHGTEQESATTSYWAGDMNNKSVPIDFIIERTGDMVEYWYSTDGGAAYEQTSRAKNTIPAEASMYVGVAMTGQAGETNTAHIEDISVEGSLVGKAIDIGDTVTIDFRAKDSGETLSFEYDIPDGAVVNDGIVTFTPTYGGSFLFKCSVNDEYHLTPVTKTVKVNVNGGITVSIDGRPLACDVSPYIANDITLVPIRAISERLGAEVSWIAQTETAVIEKDGVKAELVKDSDTAEVNGIDVTLEQPMTITQGRTMVPARFVAEVFGCEVDWSETDRLVTITQNKTESE